MHNLIKRQIKRYLKNMEPLPECLQEFIKAVDKAYNENDEDRLMLERAFDLSSQELMQVNDELRNSEEKYRLIAENTADLIAVTDMNLRFTYISPSIMRTHGFTVEEAMNMTLDQFMPPETLQFLLTLFEEELKLEASGTADPARIRILEFEEYKKDGSIIWLESSMSAQRDKEGKPIGILTVNRDITDRKKAEFQREIALEALRNSEESYTRLVNTIPDSIVRTNLEGKIIFVNDYTLKTSGYSREEIEGQNILKFISPEEHKNIIKNIDLLIKKGLGPREFNLIMKDGRKVPFEIHAEVLRNEDGTPFGLVSVCRDISERKNTEGILREKEERLRGIAQNLPGIIFQFYAKDNGEYGVSYVSEPLGEFSKIKENIDTTNLEALFSLFISRIHEEDMDRFLDSIKKAVEKGTSWNFEGRITTQSGKIIWVQGLSTPTRHKGQLVFDGILLDITERKEMEEKLHHEERRFKALVENSSDIIVVVNRQGIVTYENPAFETVLGFKPEERIGANGFEIVHPDDLEPLTDVFNTLCRNTNSPIVRGELRLRHKDGSWRTLEAVGSNLVRNNVVESIIVNYRDITERKTEELKLQQTLESLKRAVGTTIQVLVSVSESRDPYTAGHQKKSADVARAIATEMGLAQDKIEGVRMAGIIHDIGKLSIPAEILSKPNKLTEIEFALIKQHARSGYEMLKDVDSPWPLAEIVYQHHERMNGSGYPRNLKGNEILMEAKILAVADVVEAMASHRPYRPSFGIEAAIEEITNNKGILYDDTVVDTCLKLFREKGYQLK